MYCRLLIWWQTSRALWYKVKRHLIGTQTQTQSIWSSFTMKTWWRVTTDNYRNYYKGKLNKQKFFLSKINLKFYFLRQSRIGGGYLSWPIADRTLIQDWNGHFPQAPLVWSWQPFFLWGHNGGKGVMWLISIHGNYQCCMPLLVLRWDIEGTNISPDLLSSKMKQPREGVST